MWEVITTDVFDEWFLAQPAALRESVYESMGVLEKFGPNLDGRTLTHSMAQHFQT